MQLVQLPWNYDKHSNYSDALMMERAKNAFLVIRKLNSEDLYATIEDTRRLHGQYFRELTPEDHDYFAGHYRGEDFFYLRSYEVQIGGYLGCPSVLVEGKMATFRDEIRVSLAQLNLLQIDSQLSQANILHRTVEISVALFVRFLAIHPYADGNGHMSRFMILGLFGCFGLWRFRMPMHPRPGPLGQLIAQYRRGNRKPLEHYVLKNL